MTVHFPIVFMLSATFFTLLYLVSGNPSFETTAYNCLGGGIIFTPLVMFTGFLSWWVNYLARPVRAINIKIVTSFLMLLVSVAAFVWRATAPDIVTNFRASGLIYLLLIVSLSPMVAIIGWHGAKLTFPVEKG